MPPNRPALPTGRTRALVRLLALAALLWSAHAAAGPRLRFEPPVLHFPHAGGERTALVRNTGATPLHLHGEFPSPDSSGFHIEGPGAVEVAPGAAVPVHVTFTPGRLPRDATGALLVSSDDPSGRDDPRTDEADHVLGLPLRVGGTHAALGLYGPPLGAALLLLLLGRRGDGAAARWLVRLGAGTPLLTGLWLLGRFEPGLTAQDGGYGVQLLMHRALPALGLEYFVGFDGLSLGLVALGALWGALGIRPRPQGPEGPQGPGPAAWLLVLGGTLLTLSALDGALLALGWLLALAGVVAAAGRAGRRTFWLRAGCAAALGLLGAVLGLVRARSLPTALVDGTFVAHSADLIKLCYLNYFGDQRLGGLPLDLVLWLALQGVAGLPLGALFLSGAPRRERLLLSVPLCVLALYAELRLGGGLFPQAAQRGLVWLGGLGLLGAALGTQQARRAPALGAMLPPLLGAGLCASLLGLAAGTQAGLLAALLGLWRYGLGAVGLGLGLGLGLGEDGAPSRREGLIERATALLILGAPGLCGFPASVLLVLGAAPTQRLATVALVVLWVLAVEAAARAWRMGGGAQRSEGEAATGPRLVVLLVAGGLGLVPQGLITLSLSWVNDFLSHTVGHLGAAALALR